jgi:lipopolysaccharide/colanic/teichoic acid biosynthesis glycosyltransferase
MERLSSVEPAKRIGTAPVDLIAWEPVRQHRSTALVKRGIDIVGASLLLIALSPLLLLTALAIRLTSHGPALFRQRRHGQGGRVFRILKFRTMSVMEDGDVVVQSGPNDNRVTRLGLLLRMTAIDELPQLINVLKGDMSLVGPRPQAVAHNQVFERVLPGYGRRHFVKPGITGWAQVNGHRGPTTLKTMRERLAFDLWYVDNQAVRFDLVILLLTLLLPFRRTPQPAAKARQRPTLS